MYMKKALFVLAIIIIIVAGVFAFNKYKNPASTTSSVVPFSTSKNPTSSSTQNNTPTPSPEIQSAIESVPASVIIYKTKRDYSGLVWAYLSGDKTQVIAYPAPKDILGEVPVALHNGYYSGVLNANTAIINLKISSYAKLPTPLTPKQIYSLIVNKNPFSEMYDCGQKGTQTDPNHINTLIDTNKLTSECDKVI